MDAAAASTSSTPSTRPSPLPTLFLSHGSPMIALEPREAGHFMVELGRTIEARFGRPRALLVASAHTLTREPVLLAAPRHEAIYDFGGFDPKLETLRYDAPGAPELAARVAALLHGAGLPAHVVDAGGLDHGIWTALRYLWPAADVPVLPLGWPPNWPPARLMALGRALAPLAAEGVLVVGSGAITHNLRRVFAGGLRPATEAPVTPESRDFRDWFAARGAAADWAALRDYRAQAPHGVLMHPTDEHLLPFFVAAGAASGHDAEGDADPGPALRVHASFTHGDLGMDAYAFGAAAGALASALPTRPQPMQG
jgi:4,5-DOPA dioxygenase extradiol